MGRIPLQLLQSFVVFNDSKNINEAARKLGLSQPGLSKQLKQLEQYLPAEAFTLRGRKKVLTTYGVELQKRLKQRLAGIEESVGQAAALHASAESSLVRVVGRRGVLDRIAKVKFSGSLFLLEQSNEGAIEALLNMKAELGIIHAVPDTHELVAKPLFKEEFRLCLPRKFFSRKPDWSETLLRQLKDLPCLSYKPEDPLIQSLYSFYSLSGSDLRIFRAAESYATLAELMKEGLGWGLLPAYLAEENTKNWVLPVPSRILLPKQFFLAYRAEMASVAWFKQLLADVKAGF